MPLIPINKTVKQLRHKPRITKQRSTQNQTTYLLKDIPSNNGVQLIDNFDQNYNYVIEGNKFYINKKGTPYWNQSNNEKLQYEVLKFLKDNYNFRGYLDNEEETYNNLRKKYNPLSPYNEKYKNIKGQWYRQTLDGKNWFKVQYNPETRYFTWKQPDGKLVRSQKRYNIKSNQKPSPKLIARVDPKISSSGTGDFTHSINSLDFLKVQNPGDIGQAWNYLVSGNIKDAFKLAYNGISRKFHQYQGKKEDISNLPLTPVTNVSSKYNLRPLSQTGDTIRNFEGKIINDQYIIPESILVNQYKLAARNRDDLTPINTEGAIITAFGNFLPYGKHDKKYKTFIGIDPEGHIKAGDISQFKQGDLLSGTFSNDIKSIMKKDNGEFVIHEVKTYPKYDYPAYTLWNNGNPIDMPEGRALNIFLQKGDTKGQTYGEITGGRVLVKVGNELRLLSGSLSNINDQFEEMKKRNNAEYGTFYTIDNGSYNKALRTSGKNITSEQLHDYDMQNSTSGGNFLYIVDKFPEMQKFKSDTIWTPNVRTINDESYKKGHSLVNERKGIVLHHTGFTDDPNLNDVISWLTRKDGESAHVVIGEDGTRKVLARPDQVTFHAGKSIWNNRDNVNDFMIGIEFQGDTNKKDLTPQQIQSAIEYMIPIIRENNIRLEDIVTHQQVRDLYIDYVNKNGGDQADSKPDINYNNYEKIIKELLNQVYYKK